MPRRCSGAICPSDLDEFPLGAFHSSADGPRSDVRVGRFHSTTGDPFHYNVKALSRPSSTNKEGKVKKSKSQKSDEDNGKLRSIKEADMNHSGPVINFYWDSVFVNKKIILDFFVAWFISMTSACQFCLAPTKRRPEGPLHRTRSVNAPEHAPSRFRFFFKCLARVWEPCFGLRRISHLTDTFPTSLSV